MTVNTLNPIRKRIKVECPASAVPQCLKRQRLAPLQRSKFQIIDADADALAGKANFHTSYSARSMVGL